MSIESIAALLGSTKYMKPAQAKILTDLVREHDLTDILELGFFHGVSACYLGDTVRELGKGHVTALDLDAIRDIDPSAESLVARCDLQDWVTLHHDPTSYVWTLMQMLEADPTPRFDLCYLDGAHDWFTDGFAFYLVDKLLRPGGYIVFDDITWTYASSALADTERVQKLPLEQRTTPQVQKVFDLLVRTHPAYDEFTRVDDWGVAHKAVTAAGDGAPVRVVKEVVVERERYGSGALVREVLVKGKRRLKR